MVSSFSNTHFNLLREFVQKPRPTSVTAHAIDPKAHQRKTCTHDPIIAAPILIVDYYDFHFSSSQPYLQFFFLLRHSSPASSTEDTGRPVGAAAADLWDSIFAETSAMTSLDSSSPATRAATISIVKTAVQLLAEM
jgi:hypothetical protein